MSSASSGSGNDAGSGVDRPMYYDDFAAQNRQYAEMSIESRARHVLDDAQARLAELRARLARGVPVASAPPPPPAWHGQMGAFMVLCIVGALLGGVSATVPDACADRAFVDFQLLMPFDGSATDYLYSVCLADRRCSDAFFLRDSQGTPLASGRTGFGALLANALAPPDSRCLVGQVNAPFSSVVAPVLCDAAGGGSELSCEQAGLATDQAWLGCMTGGMLARPKADINQKWLYNAETGEGRAVCREDRNCDDADTTDTTTWLAIVLFIVLSAVYLVYKAWEVGAQILGSTRTPAE
jgi:hypothetical protein